jgi:hypothetical protein
VESDLGSRGTNNAFEYKMADLKQIDLYFIVVQYLQQKQIQNRIARHSNSILKIINMSNEEKQDFEQDDANDLKQKHDTAIDFFVTILCNREDFEDAEICIEYFQDKRDEEVDEIVKELLEFVLASPNFETVQDSKQEFSAQNEDELNGVFQKISPPARLGDDGPREPSLWPLICKIVVHQDVDLLNAGIVLADLPGVVDTNRTVVQTTKSYLKHPGTIFVFAEASRISTNAELEPSLTECIALGKMDVMYLIVTKTDQKSRLKDIEKRSLSEEDKKSLMIADIAVKKIGEEIQKGKCQGILSLREILLTEA